MQYPVFCWRNRQGWWLEGPRRCRSRREIDCDGGFRGGTGGGRGDERKEWKSSPKLTYLRRIPHRGTRAAVVVVGGGGGGLLMSMMLGEM